MILEPGESIRFRFDHLEQVLGLRPVLSPKELLGAVLDYFVAENVPILHIDAPSFRGLLCRRARPSLDICHTPTS
jgi:hypothetical protein